MTHDEELREQRQALNAAINKRDLETMRSFIHTSFVAKGKDGSSIDYETMMQGAAQMLNSLKDFDSQVVVEDVDVSGDSAKLVVRRTERGRAHDPSDPKNFRVFLGLGIMFLCLGVVDTVQKDFVNAASFAVGCLVCICLAFFWFRRGRPFHKTIRAQEIWQSVDGHWLVVEEQELLPAGAPLAGHEYKSKVMLLGLPLIHVASGRGPDNRRRVAKGWIAFGDIACGVLFAAGGIAVGGIAVGGLSLGVVSLAGLALGVFAFGGGAAGVWAVGGLALGVFAFGGGAIAWKAAAGGLAIAHEFAVGGGAFATHANDAVAERYMENSAFFSTAQASMPYAKYLPWLWVLALPPLLWMTWRARRQQ